MPISFASYPAIYPRIHRLGTHSSVIQPQIATPPHFSGQPGSKDVRLSEEELGILESVGVIVDDTTTIEAVSSAELGLKDPDSNFLRQASLDLPEGHQRIYLLQWDFNKAEAIPPTGETQGFLVPSEDPLVDLLTMVKIVALPTRCAWVLQNLMLEP